MGSSPFPPRNFAKGKISNDSRPSTIDGRSRKNMLGLSNSNEIKIKITSEKECLQTISVEMPVDKVKAMIEKAFLNVQGEAKIPGFRPGKSPLELIKKTFQDTAYARAQDELLREGVSEAIK